MLGVSLKQSHGYMRIFHLADMLTGIYIGCQQGNKPNRKGTKMSKYLASIKTNHDMAADTLARIEVAYSRAWYSYGYDGRQCRVEDNDDGLKSNSAEEMGPGWCARFTDNHLGGNYAWGPRASSEARAIILAMAVEIEIYRQIQDGEA
jgi:hypothetical protein